MAVSIGLLELVLTGLAWQQTSQLYKKRWKLFLEDFWAVKLAGLWNTP